MTEIQGGYKRSVMNMNIYPEYQRDFIFIDIARQAVGTIGGFANETDSQGWALTNASVVAQSAGLLPDIAWVSGTNANVYVATGLGAGTITLGQSGVSYTVVGTPINATSGGGGNTGWTVTGDQTNRWRVVLQRTDHLSIWGTLGNNIQFNVTSTTTGNHITDFHFYRLTDEVDFVGQSPAPTTGKFTVLNYFRRVFKQTVIDWNPCAIRFMDWTTPGIRWRNRTPPEYFVSSTTACNYASMLKYGLASYQTSPSTDKTVWSVAGVTGTPASYQHGEVCFTGFGSDWSTPNGTTLGGDFITNIVQDNVNPSYSKVTARNNSSSFHVGDRLQFSGCAGMTEINWMVGTIQTIGVGGANNFTVDIDCSTFGTYTTVGNSGWFYVWLTMEVGSRGAVALRGQFGNNGYANVYASQGFLYAGTQGAYPFAGYSSRCMYFDKNVISKIDPDRTVHWGAWTMNGSGGNSEGRNGTSVQAEYMLSLINELEAMIVAQGLQNSRGPINPWVNISPNAMLSTDPDYDPADNMALGMIGTLVNGYAPLGIAPLPSRCSVFLEYANETWNTGATLSWMAYLSNMRWGSSVAGFNANADMTALRAVQMVNDVRTAYPSLGSKLKPIMACHGASGPAGTPNDYGRLYGTFNEILSDSAATATIPPDATPVYYGTTYNQQASFTATGSGTNLTVASGVTGTIQINQVLNGTGIPAGTIILSQTSGTPGKDGVYVTNNATTSSGAALTSNTCPITFFWGYASAPYMDPNSYYQIIPNQSGGSASTQGPWWAAGTYNSGNVVLAGPNGGNFHNYTCNTNGTTTYPPSDAVNWTDNGPGSWNSALTYGNGSIVIGSDYHSYLSIIGSNTGNNPTTDGGVHWTDKGLNPYCSALQAFVSNGQVQFSSFTSAAPTYVTTTSDPTLKGFANGSLVMLTNYTPVSGGGFNLNSTTCFGYVSNITSGGFNINIDSSDFHAVSTGGNVTRLSGSDQEAVYAAFLQWMQKSGSDGDLNYVKSERANYTAALNPFGVFHVNYEGWEQTDCKENSSYWGASNSATDDNAFIRGCKQSQAMASAMSQYCGYTVTYGAYMPAIFTYEDTGWWGISMPSSWGFATPASGYAEWSGAFPSSEALATYNQNAYSQALKITTT